MTAALYVIASIAKQSLDNWAIQKNYRTVVFIKIAQTTVHLKKDFSYRTCFIWNLNNKKCTVIYELVLKKRALKFQGSYYFQNKI